MIESRINVAISGANGFVGKALTEKFATLSCLDVHAFARQAPALPLMGVKYNIVGDLSTEKNLKELLLGVDVVVHTAARVHVMNDNNANPLAEFRRVNVEGTLNLAQYAFSAGVRRFIYLSSVKVNGDESLLNFPMSPESLKIPLDPYGISKMEAELSLLEFSRHTGMEVVIIRPPLIYGPGVRANFRTMMNWLVRRVPLPFKAINNRRSLVSIENLIDLISLCLVHPDAAGETFMVSDGEDLSTPELFSRIGLALGRPALLFSVPPSLLKLSASLIGQGAVAQRLCGSLQVDISKTQMLLGWSPPLCVEDGLKKTAEGYLREAFN